MSPDLACPIYVVKVVKWHVDTDRFLFSFDPHELASIIPKFGWHAICMDGQAVSAQQSG
jgi:hypothetical protein